MSTIQSCANCGNTEAGIAVSTCTWCIVDFCERCGTAESACPDCRKKDHVHHAGYIVSDVPFEHAFPGDEPEAEKWSSTKRTPVARQPAPLRMK